MSVLGIIAEYNPFHNGHLHHLETAKKSTRSDHTVVVMSPNFVQRGAPAMVDKWTRTKMALLSGVDLVIEMPTVYASSSAEFFAGAGVKLLHHTKIVDFINFGSESNNIDLLSQIANILVTEPKEFKCLLKSYLDSGISFPSARAKALVDYSHNNFNLSSLSKEIKEIIMEPNNILGIEYLKALKQINSHITASTLLRKGSEYHSPNLTSVTSSATAIRNEVQKGHWQAIQNVMPQSSLNLLHHEINKLNSYIAYEELSSFLCYRLLFSTPNDLKSIMGITEGMENRILKAFQRTKDMEEITHAIKSKRFTQTAVQRMLLNTILQIKKEDFLEFQTKGGPQYIRILGFRKSSAHLLTKLKDKSTLPLVINLKKDYNSLGLTGKKMLDLEIRSTNIYSALRHTDQNLDFTHPLVII